MVPLMFRLLTLATDLLSRPEVWRENLHDWNSINIASAGRTHPFQLRTDVKLFRYMLWNANSIYSLIYPKIKVVVQSVTGTIEFFIVHHLREIFFQHLSKHLWEH